MALTPNTPRSRRLPDAGALIFVAAVIFLGVAVGLAVIRQQARPAAVEPRHRYLDSPYQAQLLHRGQLHVQSSRAIGHALPRDLSRDYQLLGYEWISITDINTLTPTDQFETPGMLVIAGTEAAFPFGHLLDYAVDVIPPSTSLQAHIDYVRGQLGLVILAHPRVAPEVTAEQALGLRGLNAIEIYDARVAREQPTVADATGTWDRLLSAGKRVWGVVGDDTIDVDGPNSTLGQTSVDVQAAELNPSLLLDGIRRGAFVASKGVRVLGVDTSSGDTIRVITTDATEIRWYGQDGALLATTNGPAGNYRVRWTEKYVRAEASRPDGGMAWTQPVFVVP